MTFHPFTEHYTPSRPYRDGRHALRYMARLNGTVWQPQPFRILDSYSDRDKKQRRFTGQGKALAVRHVESDRRFASVHEAAAAFGISGVTILKYARLGQPTRVGLFELEVAA